MQSSLPHRIPSSMLMSFLILLFEEDLISWTVAVEIIWCSCYLGYSQMRSGSWELCSPRFLVFPKMDIHIFLRNQLNIWKSSWWFLFLFAFKEITLVAVCVNLLSCVTVTVEEGLMLTLYSWQLPIRHYGKMAHELSLLNTNQPHFSVLLIHHVHQALTHAGCSSVHQHVL